MALIFVSALVLGQPSPSLEARKVLIKNEHKMPSHFHLPSGNGAVPAFPARGAAVLPHSPMPSDGRLVLESFPSPVVGN